MMSRIPRSSSYSEGTPIRPLDLSARRQDMDPCGNHMYISTPMINITSSSSDIGYNQYYPGCYQPAEEYHHDMYSRANQEGSYEGEMIDRNAHNNLNLANHQNGHMYNLQTPSPSTSCSAPSSPGYDSSHSSPDYQHYNAYSRMLPKKRKNLWRPYDSKNPNARMWQGDMELEGGSYSNSNSSSDQEFKSPLSPKDPIKRRKRNMLRYEEEQRCFEEPNTTSHMGPNLVISTDTEPSVNLEHSMKGPITSYAESINNQEFMDSTNGTMISTGDEYRKRHIFGWLSQSQKENNGDTPVCQCGEKTYIELQTVRAKDDQSANEKTNNKKQSPESTAAIDNQKPYSSLSRQLLLSSDSQTSSSNNDHHQKKKKNQSKAIAKEDNIKNGNFVSKKVYIQKRDNVVETCDEVKNDECKPRKTCVPISLTDLIEDIESDAHSKNTAETKEKEKKYEENIVKLLKQCNTIKLHALDMLMANVAINEAGPRFKSKNEKVQKAIRGDKIQSFNMLDMVELQVEISL
ncbi:hypothetical protein DPMN_011571 [Dreissena polymorpha]|uniref:Uncharacterized protein n=1 Tax=Dreissena polymorpha TaxID=45954 RepID=A0A9D4N5C3_DREPO|nr:hypothetical protein DPMN_011571 [Dreissena polymorpha]